ncbi:MAG: hypothetical protein AB202_02050 [Parcubacteria bacterium C7867-007]|nr:MAG: hypothetical protein AB202_02050 [Parcubacteria bacterium C7867-007]
MLDLAINYYAVLGAGILGVVLGMLWYGPIFGKTWMKEMGVTPEEVAAFRSDKKKMNEMNRNYVIVAISSFVLAFVLNLILILTAAYTQTLSLTIGLTVSFWVWIGFIVPVTLNGVLWEGKSIKYWIIVSGYYLVSLTLMSMILAYWM